MRRHPRGLRAAFSIRSVDGSLKAWGRYRIDRRQGLELLACHGRGRPGHPPHGGGRGAHSSRPTSHRSKTSGLAEVGPRTDLAMASSNPVSGTLLFCSAGSNGCRSQWPSPVMPGRRARSSQWVTSRRSRLPPVRPEISD